MQAAARWSGERDQQLWSWLRPSLLRLLRCVAAWRSAHSAGPWRASALREQAKRGDASERDRAWINRAGFVCLLCDCCLCVSDQFPDLLDARAWCACSCSCAAQCHCTREAERSVRPTARRAAAVSTLALDSTDTPLLHRTQPRKLAVCSAHSHCAQIVGSWSGRRAHSAIQTRNDATRKGKYAGWSDTATGQHTNQRQAHGGTQINMQTQCAAQISPPFCSSSCCALRPISHSACSGWRQPLAASGQDRMAMVIVFRSA